MHCKHLPNAIVLLYHDEDMFGMLVKGNGGRHIDPAWFGTCDSVERDVVLAMIA